MRTFMAMAIRDGMRYNTYMERTSTAKRRQPPLHFRPLLWSLKWSDIDIDEDKEDIIVNTVNDGSLEQWRWLIETYSKDAIRRILQERLTTEFHPESRNLARIIFSFPHFRNARKSSH